MKDNEKGSAEVDHHTKTLDYQVFILLISVTILSKTLLYRKKCLETGSLLLWQK